MKAVNDADFVISMTPYVTEEMKAYADVLLPVSPSSETSGTYVNAEGTWQSFTGAVTPLAETRPAWKLPIYAVDSVVRRSDALQQTDDALSACVIINEALAKQNNIQDEDNVVVIQNKTKLKLRVYIEDSIPDNCAVIPQGVQGVEIFDSAYSEITLSTKS